MAKSTRKASRTFGALLALVMGTLPGCQSTPPIKSLTGLSGDLLIQGGTVVDGTGGAPRLADVLIEDGAIVAVLQPGGATPRAARVIDAGGLVVAPGFIDPHTHADADLGSDDAARAIGLY